MKQKILHHYEIIVWDQHLPETEVYHSNSTTRREALLVGREVSKKYEAVEVSRVDYYEGDPWTYIAVKPIKTFRRNGRR